LPGLLSAKATSVSGFLFKGLALLILLCAAFPTFGAPPPVTLPGGTPVSPANGTWVSVDVDGTSLPAQVVWGRGGPDILAGEFGIDFIPDGPRNGAATLSYADPNAGGYSGQYAWGLAEVVEEWAVGVLPEGGTFSVILAGPTTYYSQGPTDGIDSLSFGFLGPTGPSAPPPPGYLGSTQGQDAYTFPLGSHTFVETTAGFFNEPADSGITFTLSGTYTSTQDARLEGQKITLTGSGLFTTPMLNVAGNLTVTGGTLSGTITIVDNDVTYLGNNAPTSTTLTVTGGNAKFQASNYVEIGVASNGPANLNLMNGAQATVGSVFIALNVNSAGNLLVDGATLNGNNQIQVGSSGTGTMTVENGAMVKLTGASSNVVVGAYATGVGTLTIESGSTMTMDGQMAVGAPGSNGNALNILSGGELTSGNGVGTSNYFGVVAGQTGNAFSNSGGSVAIDGAGSLWDIKGSLSIGSGGAGIVNVTNGGTLQVEGDTIDLGHYAGGSGTLTFDTAGGANPTLTFITANGGMYVGDGGTGHFAVMGGAQVFTGADVVIGELAGSVGDATVKDANSGWKIVGSLTVAENGTGSVSVTDAGALLDVEQQLTIGGLTGGTGTVTVQNGATLEVEGNIIRLGGPTTASGTLIFDANGGYSPTFIFNGSASSQLIVGDGGTGLFEVKGGAQISMNAALIIGNQSLSTGMAQISGLSQDGKSSVGGSLYIGGNITVGNSGTGTLAIEDGAFVTTSGSTVLSIGSQAGSVGTLQVRATTTAVQNIPTIFLNTGQTYIGDAGMGTLSLGAGAQVYLGDTIIGNQFTGNGSATEGGTAPATWQINGNLTVGSAGKGNLVVADGSTLYVSQNVFIGEQSSGMGTATISNKGAMRADSMTIGDAGMGTVTLSSKASLTVVNDLTIGNQVNSTGYMTVNQATATMQTATVGSSGSGTLIIVGGSNVAVAGNMSVGSAIGGNGTIQVSSTALSLVVNSMDLGGSNGQSGGTGLLQLLGGAARVQTVLDLWDNGTVDVASLGPAGILIVGASVPAGTAGTVLVTSGGTLEGTGNIIGNLVNDGGTVKPGHSPGTLNIQGNYTQGSTGTLRMELEGVNPGQFDVLNVSGKVTLAGYLELDFMNGFAPTIGETFDLLSFGSTAGQFTNVEVTGLQGGWTFTLDPSGTGLELVSNSNAVVSPEFLVPFGPNTVLTGVAANQTVHFLGGVLEAATSTTLLNPVILDVTGGTFQADAGTFSTLRGVISGPGIFTKTGPGALTLSAANTYTGNTYIAEGSLFVDSSLLSPNVFVELGGLLGGNGTLLGNLFNAGTVSPGHSPGHISVDGNYTQASTGLLKIEIAGAALPQHDLLSVGGTATLNGTLQLVQLNNFKLRRNEPITFLTANGGIVGKFANVADDFVTGNILEPTVVYSSNSVALEAVQGSFAKFAEAANLTPNQRAVAAGLDSAAGDHRANSLFNYLDYRTFAKLPADFGKISPDALTSIFTLGTSLDQVQSQNIQRRTDDLRSGASGFNAANLSVNGDGPSFSGGFDITTGVAGPSGDDGKEVKESKEMKEVAPTDNRWGAFLSGTGEWVSVGDTNNARGYNLESGGFTLGVDYKVCPNFAIGLMAGYTGTTSDLADGGRIYVNGGKIGLYGTTYVGGWYADIAAIGGYSSYDTRRSGLQGDPHGSPDGGDFNALFGTGYDFKKGGLTFGPTASFNYTYTGINGYNESGSLAPLNIHGGDGESLRTAFGFKASYDWKVGGIVIKPELSAAWQHEFGDAVYSLDSSFANGAGGAFTVNGPQLGRDSALLGAGFAIQCSERCSTYFYYDGELGRKNYESNSVTAGVRIAF
jgi:autotransporter-associated beta strand protein/T5SS/PEP-CTERM-associated repeat protein